MSVAYHRKGVTLTAVVVAGFFCADLAANEGPSLTPFSALVTEADGLRPWNAIHQALTDINAAHPDFTRLEVIGRSAEDRPLLALRVASDPDDPTRPTVQLVAAHHANEAATPEHVLDAVQTLLSNRHRQPYASWLQHMTLVAIPMVNPDGSHAFWEIGARLGRKSRRSVTLDQLNPGVDLNRNYPFAWNGPETRFSSRAPNSNFYRGTSPASEPEVQAMVGLAGRTRPIGLISFHSAATRLVVPYSIGGVRNAEPSAAWTVAQRIVSRLPHRFEGRRYRAVRGLYPVTGIEKDWYHHSFGTLAYVLELRYRRPRGQRLRESVEHNRGAWMTLFERWMEGPSLSVRAVDSSGAPIRAQVRFDEIVTRAGESWHTDRSHGWFHHYLPVAGEYTVRLSSGGVEVTHPISVPSGWTEVEIVVAPAWTVLAEAPQRPNSLR